MKRTIIVLVCVLSFLLFKTDVLADYKATVLITDGSTCPLKANSTGKCFYKDTNYNSVNPSLWWLDNGDVVTVIEGATYATKNTSLCDTHYVKVQFSFASSPTKKHTGYFCSSNLVKEGDVPEGYKQMFRNAGFPESYFSKLYILKQAHPNWTFRSIDTGINFNDAVNAESTLGRSLMQVTPSVNDYGYLSTLSGSYNYYTDSFNAFDGSNWYAANNATIAYYMDPRNFLVDMYIFQYEALAYEKDLQTLSVVQKLLTGDYLNNFANSFITAADASKVSPVYLASLSKQEVGGHSYATTAVNGAAFTYNGKTYSNIYNPYNIGAYSGANPVYNGLYWASGSGQTTNTYNRPWNTMDKAITEGAKWIGQNYINVGQNTIYFKKWDVVANVNANSGSNYTHQYQTNIQAPMTEGTSVYQSYYSSGIIDSSFVFYIPVYNNMPATTSLPATGNPNNYLRELKINDQSVTSFDGGKTDYNYYVSYDTNSIVINASSVNGNASISGTGYVSTNQSKTHSIVVTAQNGSKKTYNINIIKESKPVNVDTTTVEGILNKANIKNNFEYIFGFKLNENISNTINKVTSNGGSVIVKNATNNVITNEVVKTGMKITIKTNNEEKTLTTVLYGDVNGDGKVGSADYIQVKNKIMGRTTLNGAYGKAADANKDGKISSADYIKIKNHIMERDTISQ